jgi:hypothetical protein
MAIVYTKIKAYPDKYQAIYDLTLDASYPANGYVLDPKQLGMLTIYQVDGSMATGEGFSMNFTTATNKLKFFKSAAGATAFTEVANTDLTTSMKARVSVIGDPIL